MVVSYEAKHFFGGKSDFIRNGNLGNLWPETMAFRNWAWTGWECVSPELLRSYKLHWKFKTVQAKRSYRWHWASWGMLRGPQWVCYIKSRISEWGKVHPCTSGTNRAFASGASGNRLKWAKYVFEIPLPDLTEWITVLYIHPFGTLLLRVRQKFYHFKYHNIQCKLGCSGKLKVPAAPHPRTHNCTMRKL